jgi:hypothetical protein
MGASRKFHKPRIERKPFHQSELTGIFEALERGRGQPGGALPGVDRQARYDSRALRNTDWPLACAYWT